MRSRKALEALFDTVDVLGEQFAAAGINSPAAFQFKAALIEELATLDTNEWYAFPFSQLEPGTQELIAGIMTIPSGAKPATR